MFPSTRLVTHPSGGGNDSRIGKGRPTGSTASRPALLLGPERDLFMEEFEKDLRFLQVFMLMMNRSCPIRNVDLVWTENGPLGRSGWRHMGINEALGGPCSHLLHCSPGNPHPPFCNIVNDLGRREAQSCLVSDKAAEERVSRTGKAEVYRCHFGLLDIAVPVLSDGAHIATLFSGQVLNSPPTEEGFAQIVKDVEHLSYINLSELREAYFRSAVVSDEDIQSTVGILEVFAEYLASSWERLCKAVQQERQHYRELEIRRKEFAYLVLTGASTETADARAALARTGLRNCPNRVLVARWPMSEGTLRVDSDREFTAILHAIEEVCERLDNVVHAFLQGRGVCMFLYERPGSRKQVGRLNAQELAQSILDAVAQRSSVHVRVGIGGSTNEFARLGESYREACVALSTTTAPIAVYRASSEPECEATVLAAQIPELLKERRFEEARLALHSLPLHVERQFGADLALEKRLLLSAVGAMLSAGQSLGCDPAVLAELRKKAGESLGRASNSFEVQDGYSIAAETILDEVRQIYLDKGSRLVDRVCRLVERSIAEGTTMTQSSLARALGISTGHLSRVFRQTTGDTFERYVMRRRVELARRLLLDPAHNVSTVARQCGFKDASYFARVFRRLVGSSPAEYSRHPVNALQISRSEEYLPTSGQSLQ
ncbi:MAG TPA: helix-turn-helix domain-containing protein [Bryobacteraceae bacterium]|nr:helix-turn-helix domain-containing protein [Bryobacteraceae bacterium]